MALLNQQGGASAQLRWLPVTLNSGISCPLIMCLNGGVTGFTALQGQIWRCQGLLLSIQPSHRLMLLYQWH